MLYKIGGRRRLKTRTWLPCVLKRILIQLCGFSSPPYWISGLKIHFRPKKNRIYDWTQPTFEVCEYPRMLRLSLNSLWLRSSRLGGETEQHEMDLDIFPVTSWLRCSADRTIKRDRLLRRSLVCCRLLSRPTVHKLVLHVKIRQKRNLWRIEESKWPHIN